MARKPPSWRQPSLLFLPDPNNKPEPQDNATPKSKGDQNAVQDDHSRPPATTATDTRPTPQGAQAPADHGTLRRGAEDQTRSLEGDAPANEARQRPEPDR